jgi:hypothetical protein
MHSLLARLSAMDFFNVNGVKTKLELFIEFDLDLTLSGYAKLVTCLNHYVHRLSPNNRNNGSAKSLTAEFLPLKNPGKKKFGAGWKKPNEKSLICRKQKISQPFWN